MREIKFRAWDAKEEKMWWPDAIAADGRNIALINVFGVQTSDTQEDVLMQYTGLKDKNGKEIYEGDIIQAVYPNVLEPLMRKRGERYEIVYRVGAFKAFDLATKNGVIEDSFLHDKSFGRAHLEGYEVIGNIYENKELLSK